MEEDSYELVKHDELEELKREIEDIKSNPLGDKQKSKSLLASMNELTRAINTLNGILKETQKEVIDDYERNSPSNNFKELKDQNEKIAKGILALADVVNSKTDEIKESLANQVQQQPQQPQESMQSQGMQNQNMQGYQNNGMENQFQQSQQMGMPKEQFQQSNFSPDIPDTPPINDELNTPMTFNQPDQNMNFSQGLPPSPPPEGMNFNQGMPLPPPPQEKKGLMGIFKK